MYSNELVFLSILFRKLLDDDLCTIGPMIDPDTKECIDSGVKVLFHKNERRYRIQIDISELYDSSEQMKKEVGKEREKLKITIYSLGKEDENNAIFQFESSKEEVLNFGRVILAELKEKSIRGADKFDNCFPGDLKVLLREYIRD